MTVGLAACSLGVSKTTLRPVMVSRWGGSFILLVSNMAMWCV